MKEEKAKALIVEDEVIIALELENSLKNLGYQVTGVVDSSEKAIQSIEKNKPDIVLMDIHIKGELDGIDTGSQIRDRFAIPVIFSTAYFDEERIKRARITMPFGYVLKPIQEQDLRVAVEMALFIAQADTERQKSEEKYKSLVNSLPQGVYETDEAGNIIFANQTALQMFEYCEEDLDMGVHILEILAPEDHQRAVNNVMRVMAGEHFGGVDYIAMTKNSKQLPIRVYSSRVDENGKAFHKGVIIDNSEQFQIRKKLENSEEKYRLIFENAQTPYFETTMDGILLEISPSVEKQTQYKRDELIGTSILNAYTDPGQREHFVKHLFETGEIFDSEMDFFDKDGSIINVLISARFIAEDNKLVGSLMNITERKQTELALKESNEQYKTVFNTSPDLVTINCVNGTYVDVNEGFTLATGYKKDEVIGKRTVDIGIWSPEDARRMLQELNVNGSVNNLEVQFFCKDGTCKDGLISGRKIQLKGIDHILSIVRDVTDLRQIEEQRQDSKNRFRNLFERSKDAIFIVDIETGKYQDANAAAEELSGRSVEELKQLSPADIRSVQYLEHPDLLQKMKNALELEDVAYRRPDGSKRYAQVSVVQLSKRLIFTIARDITDQRKMHEMIIQNEKMMSLGGLAAGMAHELNNPLGGILQGIQNVQRRLSNELKGNRITADDVGLDLQALQSYVKKRDIESMLNGIKDSGMKASSIISNMLQFSRKSESKKSMVDLPLLVDSVLELAGKEYNLKKNYDFKQIQITKEIDEDLPQIFCTETEIEQVLLNLLSNAAWEFSEDTGNKTPRIVIRIRLEEKLLRLEVEDNGPGMDDSVKKKLFEPFFTTKPVGKGTGLGLAVCYMIITNNHQGSMTVHSKLGKGARFVIRLPLDTGTSVEK